jgi:hypothetical protein
MQSHSRVIFKQGEIEKQRFLKAVYLKISSLTYPALV